MLGARYCILFARRRTAKMKHSAWIISSAATMALLAIPAAAGPITLLFSTGNPNGLIATASRPASGGLLETETADDFILGQNALVTGATFTGLLPSGAPLSSVQDVEIELYHIFPLDSTNPPSGNVPTRTNSPSDNEFKAFDSVAGDIGVTASLAWISTGGDSHNELTSTVPTLTASGRPRCQSS